MPGQQWTRRHWKRHCMLDSENALRCQSQDLDQNLNRVLPETEVSVESTSYLRYQLCLIALELQRAFGIATWMHERVFAGIKGSANRAMSGSQFRCQEPQAQPMRGTPSQRTGKSGRMVAAV